MSTDANPPDATPENGEAAGNWLKGLLPLGLFVAVSFVQLFWGAMERDLWSSHEARAGLNARHLIASGLWFLPSRSTDLPDLQKPPGYYWMVAVLSCSADKVTPESIRGPSLLAGLVCPLFLIGIGGLLGSAQGGFWSAIILLTSVHFAWAARIGRIDLPLCGVVCGSVYFLLRLHRYPTLPNLILGALVLAVGLLLKGPIALVHWILVLFAIAIGHWLHGIRFSWMFVFQSALMLGLSLAIAAPWFVAAHGATQGEFTRSFFWEHNLDRGMGTGRLRTHTLFYYVPLFFADFFPWSLVLLCIGFFLVRLKRISVIQEPMATLGVGWFLLEFCFFSLCGYKRPDYLLPAYPGAALFVGFWLTRCSYRGVVFPFEVRWPRVGIVGAGLGILCMAGWVHFHLPQMEENRLSLVWAQKWKKLVPSEAPLVFFAEEAHALAFHWGRGHLVCSGTDEFRDLAGRSKEIWVVTNPQVRELWPQGPAPVQWEIVDQNWKDKEGHHKPLLLMKATLPPSWDRLLSGSQPVPNHEPRGR